MALPTELQAGDSAANQTRVGEVLDTPPRLQRRLLELVEREQRELAAFLRPVQPARYQAFMDFMQRRMDGMADGRGRCDGRRDGRRRCGCRFGRPSRFSACYRRGRPWRPPSIATGTAIAALSQGRRGGRLDLAPGWRNR